MGSPPPRREHDRLDKIQEGNNMGNLPQINMEKTGKNISQLRKRAGLTVKDLQDTFGFSTPQAIYKWQRGTALPTVDNLLALSVVLHVSMDDILVIDN